MSRAATIFESGMPLSLLVPQPPTRAAAVPITRSRRERRAADISGGSYIPGRSASRADNYEGAAILAAPSQLDRATTGSGGALRLRRHVVGRIAVRVAERAVQRQLLVAAPSG